jgi:hypothetical protein
MKIKKQKKEIKTQKIEPLVSFLSKKEEISDDFIDLGKGSETPVRFSFKDNPKNEDYTGNLYVERPGLSFNNIKKASLRESLIASILQIRSQVVASHGRPRPNRLETGFVLVQKPDFTGDATPEQKQSLKEKIEKATNLLSSCGSVDGLNKNEMLFLNTFLGQIARSGVQFGRFAVEIIYLETIDPNEIVHVKKFHSFRPVDVGTIYRIPKINQENQQAVSVRENSLKDFLKKGKIKGEIDFSRYVNNEYTWAQVIDGNIVQVFTDKELLVVDLFPVLDIEMKGYPICPIDSIVSEILMRLSSSDSNRLRFSTQGSNQGMIVIHSDDLTPARKNEIKEQARKTVIGVSKGNQIPLLTLNSEEKIQFMPTSQNSRDAEWQQMQDANARYIFSAFQISPDEIPGYQHLSRGTNAQALSESNNEFKLLAARDVGIRPILAKIQDFMNFDILPLIDNSIGDFATFQFFGLDSESAEREITRISQEQQVHLTMNELLSMVEKNPIPKDLAGDILMNPAYLAILREFVTVGVIRETLLGHVGDSQKPEYNYIPNQFYFQQQSLLLQINEIKKQELAQQQMQQQQMQQQQVGQQNNPRETWSNKINNEG